MSANGGASPTIPRRPTHSPTLLRKGIPGERKPLKEKLITYYELLLKVRAGASSALLAMHMSIQYYDVHCTRGLRVYLMHTFCSLSICFHCTVLGRGPVSGQPSFLGGILPAQSEWWLHSCGPSAVHGACRHGRKPVPHFPHICMHYDTPHTPCYHCNIITYITTDVLHIY